MNTIEEAASAVRAWEAQLSRGRERARRRLESHRRRRPVARLVYRGLAVSLLATLLTPIGWAAVAVFSGPTERRLECCVCEEAATRVVVNRGAYCEDH